jgi:protein-S-isoprenylcysteine O-methyltransferase Ste14
MMLWKWLAFAVLTLILVYISRTALGKPRSHGFYRFFAWECIAGLFVLNVNIWFKDAAAPHQIVSWLLLFVCIVPVIWGTLLLKQRGRPAEVRAGDPSLLAFEKTTQLVTSGIYAYIRHPLYSSLLLLAWGIFFKLPSLPGGILTLAATFFLFLTARADEAECRQYFGSAYQDYMRKTRRFIPFLF